MLDLVPERRSQRRRELTSEARQPAGVCVRRASQSFRGLSLCVCGFLRRVRPASHVIRQGGPSIIARTATRTQPRGEAWHRRRQSSQASVRLGDQPEPVGECGLE